MTIYAEEEPEVLDTCDKRGEAIYYGELWALKDGSPKCRDCGRDDESMDWRIAG